MTTRMSDMGDDTENLAGYCDEIARGELKLKRDMLDFERERFAQTMAFEAERMKLEWYRAKTDRLAAGCSVLVDED